MEHRASEDPRWIDLYVAGRLSADDEADFEMHLIECAACQEQVRVAEDLRRALREVAAEEIGQQVVAARLAGLFRLPARHPVWRWAPVLGLGLLVLALPAWLWVGRRQLERELAAAQRPDARSQQLAGQLREERQRAADLTRRLDELRRPQGNPVWISLGFLRAEPGQAQEVHLPREPGPIVLSIDAPAAGGGRYDVILLAADGRALWTGRDLPLIPPQDSLLVTFHSSFLTPGNYRLQVRQSGAPGPGAEIALRVLR